MSSRSLVIGLGNPDRGDDAVGLVVARQVAELVTRPSFGEAPDLRVVELDDPSEALDAWLGAEHVVVADAVRSGARPGVIHIVDAAAGPVPLACWAWGGTHAFGLAAVVELARAIHRLPPALVLVCVEVESLDHGAALSEAVAGAVPSAVTAVLAAAQQLELTTEAPRPVGGHLRPAGGRLRPAGDIREGNR